MKNKIFVLGCNTNQIPYIKELKKKYFIIASDKNKNAPGKKFVDIFYNYAYDDLRNLKKICLLHKDLKKIFSASSQFSIIGVSFCKKFLNMNYLTNRVCQIILNKKKFYEYLKKKKISYPKTYIIKNKRDLDKKKKLQFSCYLKSDQSKNPNYIYSGKIKNFAKKVNWIKDKYYKNYYVLQKEVVGKHLRINVVNNKLIYFDFFNQNKINKKNLKNTSLKKLETEVLNICKDLNLKNYITKFDIVLNKENYFFLDIGIDPPYRLKKYFKKKKRNFYKFYIDHIFQET